jgi:hypothetical protein
LFRKWGLSDNYLQSLFDVYDLPNTSDLCCYWFELGRRALLAERVERVGLLATQNIRGNENRTVLERIKADGDIFMAWSDRPWILEGAAVHVSLIGFDDGAEASRMLDGQPVSAIHANLTSSLNIKLAQPLIENEDLAFQGPVKVGAFDIDPDTAKQFLSDTNPHNRSNTDVIKIWIRGEELTKRVPRVFIIDFGDLEEDEASLYQAPFDHVVTHVRSKRLRTSDALRRKYWWRLGRSGEDFRAATRSHDRYLVTCQTAKHRIFSWVISRSLPAQTVIAFGRSDDYSLGVLQSSIHLVWGARQGTRLETRPRYTPTTSFETFPLPWPPGKEPSALPSPLGAGRGAGGEGASGSRAAAGNALTPNPSPAGRGGPTLTPALSQKERELEEAIASAAKELNKLRENWLNPPEWIKPIEDAVDRFEDFAGVPDEAKPLLRQSAIMARAAKDAKLKKRTLTNLYNERPGWLKIAHRKLDEAVLAAYRDVDAHAPNPWDVAWAEAYEPFGAGEITINRKGKKPDSPEVIAAKEVAIAQRKIIDEKILANLLRLNQERAAKEAMAQA